VKILIDFREKPSGLPALLSTDFTVEMSSLPTGDYIINNHITIERKTAADFPISIIDQRLFTQVARMKKHCRNPLLLIEGNPYTTGMNIHPLAIRGAILSVQTSWQIPVLFSNSIADTKEIFILIGKQDTAFHETFLPRGGYRPKRLANQRFYILQGLPGIGPQLARRLLEHFKTITKVVNASVYELSKVEGIGPNKAETIRKVLG